MMTWFDMLPNELVDYIYTFVHKKNFALCLEKNMIEEHKIWKKNHGRDCNTYYAIGNSKKDEDYIFYTWRDYTNIPEWYGIWPELNYESHVLRNTRNNSLINGFTYSDKRYFYNNIPSSRFKCYGKKYLPKFNINYSHLKQTYINELINNGWEKKDINTKWSRTDLLKKIINL